MRRIYSRIKNNGIKSFVLWCGWLVCLLFNSASLFAQTDITLKNGETYNGFPFPVSGCAYSWVNDNPSIGLQAGKTGDIPPFVAKNTGSTPIKATITINTAAINPSGYLVGDQTTGVFNLNSKQVDKTLPISNSGGSAYAFNADGSLLYIYNANIAAIEIINTATNTKLTPIPVNFSRNLVVNPHGVYIYFADNDRKVSIIDMVNTTEKQIDVGAGANSPLLVMSPDGNTLYVSKNNRIFYIDVVTNAIANTVTLPTVNINTLSVSPDGKELYASGDRNIYVINEGLGTFSNIAINALVLGSPVVNPNGRAMYFTDGGLNGPGSNQNVYLVDLITRSVTTIALNKQFFYLTLSDDGSNLYATEESTGNVYVINTSTKQIAATININAAGFGESAKSFASIRHSGTQLYVTSLVTGSAGSRSFVTVINTATNLQVDRIPLPPNILSSLLITGIAEKLCISPTTTFTITVEPDPPGINASGAPSRLTSSYGSPSSATTFSVSGTNVNGGITVTPPPGFEVSADATIFSPTVKIGTSGTIPPTTVYIRLSATSVVGSYSGNILLSAGSSTANLAMTLSEVLQAPLAITANHMTKTYGSALVGGSNKTTFTSIGLKNGETIGSVTFAYGAGAGPTDQINTYPGSVIPSTAAGGTFAPANYFIVYRPGDLEVTPAPLTITADDKQKFYTEANPTLTVTYSGFVNNENESQLITVPTVSTSATIASLVGLYPISVTGASATNYTITYVPGMLNILPKTITPTTAFTPNGDGVNDTWVINSLGQYPKCTVEIMDRYGAKVYQNIGYTIAWDGKRNGASLPTGTYYYVIKLNDELKPITGNLTIIR